MKRLCVLLLVLQLCIGMSVPAFAEGTDSSGNNPGYAPKEDLSLPKFIIMPHMNIKKDLPSDPPVFR